MIAHGLLSIVRIMCLLVAADTPAEKVLAEELAVLSGMWLLESVEFNGEKEDLATAEIRVEIKGNQWSFRTTGGAPAAYALKIDPANMPKTMDLTLLPSKEQKGLLDKASGTSEGIYEVSKERLRMCSSGLLREGARERPTTFTSKQGSGFIILVLKRLNQ